MSAEERENALKDLQYKMFLLNKNGNNKSYDFNGFTIQNVPIKSYLYVVYFQIYDNLQYKMFLLN